jgi:hypothetical protein
VNQATLPQIKMPNREGFVVDPRPDNSDPQEEEAVVLLGFCS